MSKRTKKVSGWLTGAVVAAALGFGALVATATPANAVTCLNDGWDWMGDQPTEPACLYACQAVHGEEAGDIWFPTSHCCRCLY